MLQSQSVKTGTGNALPLREVSVAVMMISLVAIYTVSNVPMSFLWAIAEAVGLLSPTSNLISVLFNAAQFFQVSDLYNVMI